MWGSLDVYLISDLLCIVLLVLSDSYTLSGGPLTKCLYEGLFLCFRTFFISHSYVYLVQISKLKWKADSVKKSETSSLFELLHEGPKMNWFIHLNYGYYFTDQKLLPSRYEVPDKHKLNNSRQAYRGAE